MGLRPMLYFYEDAPNTCGQTDCVQATMLIGTPAMWWLSLPMIAWGLWRAIARLDWRYATVIGAYLAGLLPWFLNLDRQMYFYHSGGAQAPFLCEATSQVLPKLTPKVDEFVPPPDHEIDRSQDRP